METLHRLGTFFILVGLALLVLFVGSVVTKDTNAAYLLLSLPTFLVAFLLRRNKPINEGGRFEMIRRARERSRQHRAERLNQKYKK